MKKVNNKKIFSAFAVLAMAATACVAIPVAACGAKDSGNANTIEGNTYYVTTEGSPVGDGSKKNPYDIYTILSSPTILQPGDTVLVSPGTYKIRNPITMTASGLYNGLITIKNSSTKGEKVVIDFSDQGFLSTNRGIQLYSDYVYWYGIDICGAGDNGLYIGGSYNTIEYCEFYNNRDTGLQLGRKQSADTHVEQWPSFNLIKNCTSHNNYDNETYGENADGFAAKLTIGYGNVFDGCIAYRNSDDGWDLYAKTDSGNIGQVIIYNCVAFENGYLEYTQEVCNEMFPYFNSAYAEGNQNSYKTRDGDGNGFKLGGSVMEGDVLMYNCLSFGNRMHGVTDNSNPGFLSVNGVTSYNNSAAIDNDPSSATFGQIKDISNDDTHSNIDLARQTYSYNAVSHVLSVKDSLAKSLGSDAYRGSVIDSVLGNYKVTGSIDADTKTDDGNKGSSFTAPASSDIFSKLPYTKSGNNYTYNISGLKDMGDNYEGGAATNKNRVHIKYRNSDGSINMHDILAVKDYSKLFGKDNKIGSVLNLGSWSDYTHFTEENPYKYVTSRAGAVLVKAKETLTVNCDPDAVYQDFDVATTMVDCKISWSSSNEDLVRVGKEYDVSLSNSEYINIEVNRPTERDTEVTLTATISYHNRTITKDFVLNVKKDQPKIGDITAHVASQDVDIADGGKYIIDLYRQYEEPTIQVKNGAYVAKSIEFDGKLLTSDQYTYTTTYEYSTDDNLYAKVSTFSPNTAGVYRITHTVSLAGSSVSKSMTYKIYVASASAQVDFTSKSITVNRDGFIISGSVNNPTGTVYAVSSPTQINVNASNIKTLAAVQQHDLNDTSVNFQFTNENANAYYIYYALANKNGEVTSQIYTETVGVVEIDTLDKFQNLAKNGRLGTESANTTIYKLTKCLDFTGYAWTAGNTGSGDGFKGLLNGDNHTVSNIRVESGSLSSGKVSIFGAVSGGTIMNIKFDNITLKSTNESAGQKVGIVGICFGGYFSNIEITNIDVAGTQRVAALIGQLNEGTPTYIDRVSVINTDSSKQLYASSGSVGSLIGLMQLSSGTAAVRTLEVHISNCYANLVIGPYRYSGGFVGRYDSQQANVNYILTIESCLSAATIYASYNSAGGMLGAQQGNGTLNISKCVFIGTLYHTYDLNNPQPLTVSQKNASGMIGGFVEAADVTITRCVSILEEYNPDYQEGVTFYAQGIEGLAFEFIFTARFDTSVWELHYKENTKEGELEAPYATLIFDSCTD